MANPDATILLVVGTGS
ncbi:hypothetical protein [Limosilactobacillus fermentum]|nr:hypothetical protein [Limosilactobacillus fermentum]